MTRKGEKEDRRKKEGERKKEETVTREGKRIWKEGNKEGNTYRYCTNLYM